jgi:ADP-ribosyl-[dinitrogen reductase] hydrolase
MNQKGVGSGPEGQIDAHRGVDVRKPELRGLGYGTVWGCLAQALWAVRTTGSFEDALVAAVNLGDDTDTVACVAGAIAGARYGLQTMPSRWTTYVHGHVATPDGDRQYDFGSLQDMARQLIGLHRVTLTPPEPAFSAMEVAPGLHAANLLERRRHRQTGRWFPFAGTIGCFGTIRCGGRWCCSTRRETPIRICARW